MILIERIDMDLFGLFENKKKDKGNAISKKIGKEIKKKKQFKSKGRGITRKSYFVHDKSEDNDDNKIEIDENKNMDIDAK